MQIAKKVVAVSWLPQIWPIPPAHSVGQALVHAGAAPGSGGGRLAGGGQIVVLKEGLDG